MKFAVGDRVRVYGNSQTGAIDTPKEDGECGLVSGICSGPSGFVNVDLDGDLGKFTFHTKQLRRLKPKRKPREFWVNKYNSDNTAIIHFTEEEASLHASATRRECIHVREVIE